MPSQSKLVKMKGEIKKLMQENEQLMQENEQLTRQNFGLSMVVQNGFNRNPPPPPASHTVLYAPDHDPMKVMYGYGVLLQRAELDECIGNNVVNRAPVNAPEDVPLSDAEWLQTCELVRAEAYGDIEEPPLIGYDGWSSEMQVVRQRPKTYIIHAIHVPINPAIAPRSGAFDRTAQALGLRWAMFDAIFIPGDTIMHVKQQVAMRTLLLIEQFGIVMRAEQGYQWMGQLAALQDDTTQIAFHATADEFQFEVVLNDGVPYPERFVPEEEHDEENNEEGNNEEGNSDEDERTQNNEDSDGDFSAYCDCCGLLWNDECQCICSNCFTEYRVCRMACMPHN